MRNDQKSATSNDRLIVQSPDQLMVPQGGTMFISYPTLPGLEAALAMTMNALECGCKVIVVFQGNSEVDRFRGALDAIEGDIDQKICHRLSVGATPTYTVRVRYEPIPIRHLVFRDEGEDEPRPGQPGDHYKG